MNGFGRAVAVALAMALPGLAAAQGTSVSFGGLRQDPTQPVEINADSLSLSQSGGTATFSGNVLVVQGTLKMQAAEIVVTYVSGEDGAQGKVERIVATGGVTLTNGEEAAESESAVYSVAAGDVAMEGDVLLTQGENAIAGQQLRIDLATGEARMEGRVKTVLQPGGDQ